ncbi:hypothetical protein HYH02_007719 [Chlamydomonas schloesseri]|uniref:Uncharacterized protein n=1 Tax=Chlamydomonas schloesseri TaxID=2026947 RepID=A0A835WHR1_9CHLO|nr:hypothetical protein HYH02_007719 [Chlamydomonas schloesseri]|eukprot:KAG2447391.1 hypothetical protein HYH02_007719 [Chlamydomonas schloesseri]
MVVYALPGDVHLPPKKRHFGQTSPASCEASSPSKRSKHEGDVLAADMLPAALVLGAELHVDGLLELLTGALCSALGTDGIHCDTAPAVPVGPSGTDVAPPGPAQHAAHTAGHAEPAAPLAAGQSPHTDAATASISFDVLRCSLPALTIPRPPAAPPADELDDEDDRSSVVSLSAWVGGTPGGRRRGSEVAGGQGPGSGGVTPLSGFLSFSFAAGGFTPRAAMAAQAAAAAAPCSSCESVGSDPAAAWPRRRLSNGGRR